MTNQSISPNDFDDYSSIEKQVAEIKKYLAGNSKTKTLAEQNNETSLEENDEKKEESVKDILLNQLSVLQDIQYLLSEIEKNSRKKKRSFF
jgi:DNA-binding transcriptional MerR regulator